MNQRDRYGPGTHRDAMKLEGWQPLNTAYARRFGIEAPAGRPASSSGDPPPEEFA